MRSAVPTLNDQTVLTSEDYLFVDNVAARSTNTSDADVQVSTFESGEISTSGIDYLADWRELKLEREVWRSADMLGMARQDTLRRKHFYAGFYEPASIASHASS